MSQTVIALEDVSIYQGDTLVLSQVNLVLEEAAFAYLIGKTGAGKSSLLKLLYGDLPLGAGKGECVGYELGKLKRSKIPLLRRHLGIVFQDFQLLMDRTVMDNLLFVLRATGWKDKKSMKARAMEVLEAVGLGTKDFKMPHALSGGEQQRVVIARSLLNNPPLILADEPTGNLDPDTSDDIVRLLMRLNHEMGTAMLIATHDYAVIEKFPARILRVHNGILTETEGIQAR